jgi:hypothetical protein
LNKKVALVVVQAKENKIVLVHLIRVAILFAALGAVPMERTKNMKYVEGIF